VQDHVRLAQADPVMKGLVESLGELSVEARRRRRPRRDAYGALLGSVISQQLSTKAAATIHGRVVELFGGRTPAPAELLAVDPARLRACGLSGRKVEYVRDLAAHVDRGELELDRLADLPDDQVIAEIGAIRGFGRWSAEMFLIFFLGRPDVLPAGDLGIRKAVKVAYGLGELPDAERLERIARPWRPQRSLACIYLWESLDNAPPAG